MQQLIIIRGIPGAGKSTLATQLQQYYSSIDVEAIHFEADMYFTKDGVYNWEPSKIGSAHEWCRSNAELALSKEKTVIVSNTFTLRKELQPYFEMIQEYGKNPTVISLQSNFGSVHNVPEATLLNMKKRFQNDISDMFI